jgi:hypothetical protein
MAEGIQRDGEIGLDFTKRWLESTTWIELPFDVYANETVCTMERLDGKVKRYDAFGTIHTAPPTPLLVENKAYNSAGGKQAKDYWEFLANAYSITAKKLQAGRDSRFEFMWVTTHPFEQTDWNELTSPARVLEALEKDPEACGSAPDTNLVSMVAERLWLLVLHDKQSNLMLSPSELSDVEAKLNRKGKK